MEYNNLIAITTGVNNEACEVYQNGLVTAVTVVDFKDEWLLLDQGMTTYHFILNEQGGQHAIFWATEEEQGGTHRVHLYLHDQEFKNCDFCEINGGQGKLYQVRTYRY